MQVETRRRLMVLSPQHLDAISWYRACGPFSVLKQPGWDIMLHKASPLDWSDIASIDALFLQRPYSESHLAIIKLARSFGKTVWLDYDDNLFDVPVSNPAHDVYGNSAAKARLKEIISLADVISVSTLELEHVIASQMSTAKRTAPIVVIPNAFNDLLFKPQKRDFKQAKTIFWRGSPTHCEDLAAYSQQMVELGREHPDWKWVFYGYKPWDILRSLPNASYVRHEEILAYFHNAATHFGGSVCIVPLEDNSFNRCKSNIAWQEATSFGMATVAPAWDEWRFGGINPYTDGKSFKAAVKTAMSYGKTMYESSYDSLIKYRALSEVNKLRGAILSQISAGLGESVKVPITKTPKEH